MNATDNLAYKFPVSIKGIIEYDHDILLLQNARDEWELPGGKLELYEDPVACLEREIREETHLDVTVNDIVDTWQYHITEKVDVFVVTYSCAKAVNKEFSVSHEHKIGQWFTYDEIETLNLPAGYKNSIQRYVRKQREMQTGNTDSCHNARECEIRYGVTC